MVFRGIELRDWLACVRARLTICRREGHFYKLRAYYCSRCGGPWLFAIVTDPPLRGPSARDEW